MTLQVFALYDSKVGAFAQPFYLHAIGEAKRAFTELCNDSNSQPNKYPEDFALFHLGSYDSAKGSFTNLISPMSLGLAIEFISQK